MTLQQEIEEMRKCRVCGSGKKLTIREWNECPVQLAEWKADCYLPLLPRFITYWWYFRKKPKHLTNNVTPMTLKELLDEQKRKLQHEFWKSDCDLPSFLRQNTIDTIKWVIKMAKPYKNKMGYDIIIELNKSIEDHA